MKDAQPLRSILVPVLDGDISEAALKRGRSMLGASDARLVLVHIVKKPEPGESAHEGSHLDDASPPRWRQLARAAHPGRVFVEVLEGDPSQIIPVEAERFHSDAILLDGSVDTPQFPSLAHTTPLSPPPQEALC